MANVEGPPELTEGALYLLSIARENDTHRAMAKNAAILEALDFGKELIDACRERKLAPLSQLLGTKELPPNFLAITAAVLRRVRDRVDEYMRDASRVPRAPDVSDFNRHVLQGLAEALADLAWPDRTAQDFDGPPPRTFLSELARHDPQTLWTLTLQHYLANIFQDYFAALRVREELTDLEPTVEVDLRLVDAASLAEYVMRLAVDLGGDEAITPELVAFALNQAIDETLGE